MGKRNKKHWAANTDDPTAGRKFRLACGRWAWINSAKESGPLWSLCGASVFRDLSACDPDWHCFDCAKAARLALAAESAPKPSDVVWPTPRPISEAPTDGSMVLIRLPDYDPQWTIGVFDPRRRWVDLCLAGATVEPTHFLPLPPEVR